jgi:integrase
MHLLAHRTPRTVKNYEYIFLAYARFLGVPLDEIHNHLVPENLIKFSESLQDWSPKTIRVYMAILHRYFVLNGVTFDPLELNIVRAYRMEEPDDKPLELSTLQKMMDLTNVHGKAILSTLISTGMRRSECAKVLLSDLDGDTIKIRSEIAKGGRGGTVYLTSEAQEFVTLWLRERDEYIRRAGLKLWSEHRPTDDQRLFACSGSTMRDIFARLYQKVDGEKGKYHDRCTLHSCRRYFRTHAVQSMPLDLVEKILRHTGYLTGSYVRISDEEARKGFHDGEHVLYITRKDQRMTQTQIDTLHREKVELEAALSGRITLMEKRMEEIVQKGRK